MSANLLSCELLLHVNELETLEQLVLNGADLNYQAKNGWCLLFEFVSLNLTKQLNQHYTMLFIKVILRLYSLLSKQELTLTKKTFYTKQH